MIFWVGISKEKQGFATRDPGTATHVADCLHRPPVDQPTRRAALPQRKRCVYDAGARVCSFPRGADLWLRGYTIYASRWIPQFIGYEACNLGKGDRLMMKPLDGPPHAASCLPDNCLSMTDRRQPCRAVRPFYSCQSLLSSIRHTSGDVPQAALLRGSFAQRLSWSLARPQ